MFWFRQLFTCFVLPSNENTIRKNGHVELEPVIYGQPDSMCGVSKKYLNITHFILGPIFIGFMEIYFQD